MVREPNSIFGGLVLRTKEGRNSPYLSTGKVHISWYVKYCVTMPLAGHEPKSDRDEPSAFDFISGMLACRVLLINNRYVSQYIICVLVYCVCVCTPLFIVETV